jgi:hypothetical protein
MTIDSSRKVRRTFARLAVFGLALGLACSSQPTASSSSPLTTSNATWYPNGGFDLTPNHGPAITMFLTNKLHHPTFPSLQSTSV